MTKDLIFCVDDDSQVIDTLYRDLAPRYGERFDIETFENAEDALDYRSKLLRSGRRIALYIVDQRMPGMTGIEFLEQLEEEARKILLTAYADTDVAIKGINEKCVDYYVMKPYSENFFANIDTLISDKTKNFFFSLTEKYQAEIFKKPTPFFLFNLDVLEQKYQSLTKLLPDATIFYAVKANGLIPVLQRLKVAGCRFEINNTKELENIIEVGADPSMAINSSPICSAENVRKMFGYGVRTFCVDSFSQIDNLAVNAPETDTLLRIFVTNRGSKFDLSKRLGARMTDCSALVQAIKDKGLNPIGLTFHVGSQCANLNNWEYAIQEASQLFKEHPELNVLNMGGGFPIYYTDSIPPIENICHTIQYAIDKHFPHQPQLWIEPGRFLVGDSAVTVTSALQMEERAPVSRVITDMSVFTGFIEKLQLGDNFQYPIYSNGNGERFLCNILGCTCDGTDILATGVHLPKLKIAYGENEKSDRIVFLNTGAYTLDYTNLEYNNRTVEAGFNGAPIPHVYFMTNSDIFS